MTVHFIGAGPGAPDLLTLRGRDLIAKSPVVLYAGSLVPPEVVAHAPEGARVLDTAPMTLDAIIAEIAAADAEGRMVHPAGLPVKRLHAGHALDCNLDTNFVGFLALDDHGNLHSPLGDHFAGHSHCLDRINVLATAHGLNVLGNYFVHRLGLVRTSAGRWKHDWVNEQKS